MKPADLRFIVKSTVLNYLVCSSDISRDHIVMLEYFKCFGPGVFGDEILSQIIKDFPGELTDELLIALSPPHLRHLKLTNCSRLSCIGLQKTIAKCQQLRALDFSECIHLLHPTVFCCLKDKASNLVSLSLENSQVVSDDIVQVALMCCPGLKHLNLSGCRNITDAAFAFPNTDKSQSSTASAYNSTSSSHLSQPGHNLTNVDISGCQCLSTVAVKYLARLCGANLKGINLAWTGVNCTALLYLAGLNMDLVARLVQEADTAVKPSGDVKPHPPYESSADRQTGEKQTFVACDKEDVKIPLPLVDANLEMQDHNIDLQPCVSSTSIVGVEVAVDPCNSGENQDVHSIRRKSLRTTDLQEFTESSDEESDDSFKTATNEIEPYFLSEEETGFATTVLNTSRTDESLECHARHGNNLQSNSDITGLCGVKEFCSTATTENNSTIGKLEVNQNSDEDVCVLADNRSKTYMDPQKMLGSEHHIDRNPGMFSSFSKRGEEETVGEDIFEDSFDAGKDPAVCKEQGNIADRKLHVVHQCVFKTHTSLDKDCNNAGEATCNMAVNGMKPVEPTMTFKGVKDGDFSNCGIMSLARMDHEEAEYSKITCDSVKYGLHKVTSDSLPCNEAMDSEKLQCEDTRTQHTCTSHHEEPVCPVRMDAKVSEIEGSDSAFVPHNPLIEATLPDVQYNNVKSCEFDSGIKSCHGVILSSGPHEEFKHSGSCSDTETAGTSDCLSSCSKAIKFSDMAQAQIYHPQITSLDITNICYQSKPLGELCLKVFSNTCKCLKSFAVSWTQLDDEVLIYLLKNEPELESLSLVDCENVGDISIGSIPVHCPKLTSFDLKGMCYVTDHGVMPLTRSNELQSLCLAEAAITDLTLESISKGCGAKLKDLDVSWCEDIADCGMSVVANSCSSLQHLSLRQCAASHLTLNPLAANCHLISTLNIAGLSSLTDTTLNNLAKNMPLLREIDASWNSSLSDIGVSALLQFCTQLNKAVLCGLKRITSQPFLAIIGDLGRWCLLEELWRYSRGSQGGAPKGKVSLKTCNSEKAKSIGDQIPWRSMSYAQSLRQILLEYSDKVNDDHLAAVVAVCRGTLFVRDYYGQPVEPKWIFR